MALAFREYRLGPFKMDFLNWCLTAILGIFIILLLLMRSACHPVIANGSSMEPTIHDGCVYVTNADFSERDLVYGTIVVVKRPDGLLLIKRIEGCPGDKIRIENGILYRNGQAVNETFPAMEDAGMYAREMQLDGYFVLGDNRNHSNDSRAFGCVALDDIRSIISNTKPVFSTPDVLKLPL